MKTKKISALTGLIIAALFIAKSAMAAPFPFSFWANQACTDVATPWAETFANTGTVLAQAAACSPSKVYCLSKTLIETGASDTWHFQYSTTGGASWTDFATTKNAVDNVSDDYGGNFFRTINRGIVVADNGKAFALYAGDVAGNDSLNAVYTDLSAGTPALSDSAATGVDSFNTEGATAGIVARTGSGAAFSGQVFGDSTLGTVIVVMVNENASSNNVALRIYSSGGATHTALNTAGGISTDSSDPYMAATYGSGAGQRVMLITNSGSNSNQHTFSPPFTGAASSNTTINGGSNRYAKDIVVDASGRGHLTFINAADNDLLYQTFTDAGTPSFSTAVKITALVEPDTFGGYSSASIPLSAAKLQGQTTAINPSDGNNAVIAVDMLHPDSVRRPMAIEIRDAATAAAPVISQYATVGFSSIGSSAGSAYDGQTVTFAGEVPRTVAFIQRQNGTIPSGVLSCEIWAAAGSPAIPTGSALYTSTNVYVAKNLSKNASGQAIFCNFSGVPALTGAYAVAVRSTAPLDGTNNLSKSLTTANPYAGGNYFTCDNTNVCTGNASADLVFEVSTEWLYPLESELADVSTKTALAHQSFESSAQTDGSSSVNLLHRLTPTFLGTGYYPITGAPVLSRMTWGSGSAASTFDASTFSGYATGFDKHLVFNTQCGMPASSSTKNRTTGALDANIRCEDRSLYAQALSGSNNLTTTTDGDFDGGFATDFNGSSSYSTHVLNDSLRLNGTNHLFWMGAEIKLDVVSGNQTIAGYISSATSSGGWLWFVNSSGKLAFQHNTGGTVTVGSTVLSTGVKYDVEAYGDGAAIRLKINGSQPAYDSQQTGGYTMTTTNTATTSMGIGAYSSQDAAFFNGRIGTFRIARGDSAPVSAGYVYQAPITNLVNLGTWAFGAQWNGQNASSTGTGFRSPGAWKMFGLCP